MDVRVRRDVPRRRNFSPTFHRFRIVPRISLDSRYIKLQFCPVSKAMSSSMIKRSLFYTIISNSSIFYQNRIDYRSNNFNNQFQSRASISPLQCRVWINRNFEQTFDKRQVWNLNLVPNPHSNFFTSFQNRRKYSFSIEAKTGRQNLSFDWKAGNEITKSWSTFQQNRI